MPKDLVIPALILWLLASTAHSAPLSCNVQRALYRAAAMARDGGMPEARARASLERDGELSQQEISTILKSAYVTDRNMSPDALGESAYAACQRPMKASPSSETYKTAGLPCNVVGYRYGYTATRAMRGSTTEPSWDFVVPARCKEDPKLEKGIRAGTEASAREMDASK